MARQPSSRVRADAAAAVALLQLLAPEPAAYRDVADDRKTLKSLGIAHGSLVYFRYTVAREVTPNPVPVASKPFGACQLPAVRGERSALRGLARRMACQSEGCAHAHTR